MLVAFMDLFMQLPVIATYSKSLDSGATMVGVIVGMYSAANILGNIGAGALLDRVNRRRLIASGMALTAVSLFAYGFVESPAQLLVLRALHGLAAGVLAPGAFAMLGDRTRAHQARSMGESGALIALAAVVGPPIAGIVGDTAGFAAVFTVSGALMLAVAAAFILLVADAPNEISDERAASGERPHTAVRDRDLLRVYFVVLAMTYGMGTLVGHLPIAIDASGGSSRMAGAAFATFSIIASFVMAFPLQRRLDAVSRKLAVSLGLLLIAASGGALMAFSTSGTAYIFPAMVVFGCGFGMLFPSLGAAVSERAGRKQRGMAFGIFYAVYSLGVALGSVGSGAGFEAVGSIGFPFLLSALVAVAGLLPTISARWVSRGER